MPEYQNHTIILAQDFFYILVFMSAPSHRNHQGRNNGPGGPADQCIAYC
jgi:hypothetical protein